jgi:hypothetical protein
MAGEKKREAADWQEGESISAVAVTKLQWWDFFF